MQGHFVINLTDKGNAICANLVGIAGMDCLIFIKELIIESQPLVYLHFIANANLEHESSVSLLEVVGAVTLANGTAKAHRSEEGIVSWSYIVTELTENRKKEPVLPLLHANPNAQPYPAVISNPIDRLKRDHHLIIPDGLLNPINPVSFEITHSKGKASFRPVEIVECPGSLGGLLGCNTGRNSYKKQENRYLFHGGKIWIKIQQILRIIAHHCAILRNIEEK